MGCPHGHLNESDAVFCKTCGQAISRSVDRPEPSAMPAPSRAMPDGVKNARLGALVVVALLAVLATTGFYLAWAGAKTDHAQAESAAGSAEVKLTSAQARLHRAMVALSDARDQAEQARTYLSSRFGNSGLYDPYGPDNGNSGLYDPYGPDSVDRARANVDRARANVNQAKENVNRARAKLGSSQRPLDEANARLDSSMAIANQWLVGFTAIAAVGGLLLAATAWWALAGPGLKRDSPGASTTGPIAGPHDKDQAEISRLQRRLRGLRWVVGLTGVGWVMAAFGGADPRYTPPFGISTLVGVVLILVISSRIRKLANPRRS